MIREWCKRSKWSLSCFVVKNSFLHCRRRFRLLESTNKQYIVKELWMHFIYLFYSIPHCSSPSREYNIAQDSRSVTHNSSRSLSVLCAQWLFFEHFHSFAPSLSHTHKTPIHLQRNATTKDWIQQKNGVEKCITNAKNSHHLNRPSVRQTHWIR